MRDLCTKVTLLLIALGLFMLPAIAEEVLGAKGCIDTHKIESFKYYDPMSAKVTLRGGKEVLVIFKKRCFGLRHNGVIYETRNNRLCAGFDHVRVLEHGSLCLIDQIVPFVEPEPEPKLKEGK